MHSEKDIEDIFKKMDLETQKKRDERRKFVYISPEGEKSDEKLFYYIDISTKSEDEEEVCLTGMK